MNLENSQPKSGKTDAPISKKMDKEARLAKALRDNLRRRKAANPSVAK